jgi:C-terminal processing protease CtpA/Prc
MKKAHIWKVTALLAIPLMAAAAQGQGQSNSTSQQNNEPGQTKSASGNQGSNSNKQATNSSSSNKNNSTQAGENNPNKQQQNNSNAQQGSSSRNSQQGTDKDNRTASGDPAVQRAGEKTNRKGETYNRNRTASDLGFKFERNSNDGLIISSVSTSGPIARLGFRKGDRIVSVDGHRVNREDDIVRYLFVQEQHRIPVIVIRDKREETIYVEPAMFVEEDDYVGDPLERFGFVIEERGNQIIVIDVTNDSPAYRAGIRRGDVLVMVGGHSYRTKSELVRAVGDLKSGEAKVQVQRNQKTRDFSVSVPQAKSRRGESGRNQPSDGARRNADRDEQSNRGDASSDNAQNKRTEQREREEKVKGEDRSSSQENSQSKSPGSR